MNYGLGSDDQEELAYYNKIRKEMEDMKKTQLKKVYRLIRITLKEWINESEYFFINWRESYANWDPVADDSKRQKKRPLRA